MLKKFLKGLKIMSSTINNKIDYVVISSDDNSQYKDFYEVVSKQWNKLGYKTYYINITDVDEEIENEFGIFKKIKSVDGVPSSFQSQVVRLYSCNLIFGNLLISDIDMLPISKRYFDQLSNDLNEENIVLASGQPYTDVPYYPMCYVASNNETLKKTLQIENFSFEEFCNYLVSNYGLKWNTDEHFMYDRLSMNKNILIEKTRNFNNRIDRSRWTYNTEDLKKGFYVDSHLLRPYIENKTEINNLIDKIQYDNN
jgi:hypothetical protein